MKKKQHILIIEDSKRTREYIDLYLEDVYATTFATCQKEALVHLAEHGRKGIFDLVLLDLKLPVSDSDMSAKESIGREIALHIKKKRYNKQGSRRRIPVIVMTAYGSERLASDLYDRKLISSYIPKPFNEESSLKEKIKSALVGKDASAPAGDLSAYHVLLSFNKASGEIWIEGKIFRDGIRRVMTELWSLFEEDRSCRRLPSDYRGLTGEQLSGILGVTEHSVRQAVRKFRNIVIRDFADRLHRTINKDDIVENLRDRNGYRLNPNTVQIVDWEKKDA